MKSIKGKDWIQDAGRFVKGVVQPIIDSVLPKGSIRFEGHGWKLEAKLQW